LSGDSAGQEVLVAVVVGTSGARAAAFDLAGQPVAEARRPYPTATPRDGRAEQDAGHWRRASISALAALIRALQPGRPVLAIGMTGQCPSVVPVDGNGQPLRPAIIYRENPATAAAQALTDQFGDSDLHARTGHVPTAFHLAAKIGWIRANEPAVFAAARRFLEPSEFVALALTKVACTDWTTAGASALFDIRRREWAPDLLDACGLDAGQLATVFPSWLVAGELRPAIVRRLGLRGPVPVIAGAADSLGCAFGAGVITPGPVSEMAGSSTCLNSVVTTPLTDPDVSMYPSPVRPDGYMTETGINTAGEAVGWIAALGYASRKGRPTATDYARLDREAAAMPAGADGLLFVPVLGDGERDDPGLRGTAVGLSLRHDRAAWARATFEGVALGIRRLLEVLGRDEPAIAELTTAKPTIAELAIAELRVSGQAASLAAWNQIKADVLGIPVRVVAGDATTAGVAMLAGLGSGVYASPADAVAAACRAGEPVWPDPANHARNDEPYDRYLSVRSSALARVPSPGDSPFCGSMS
jgi:sugar (pentulose or hexulose) kinase